MTGRRIRGFEHHRRPSGAFPCCPIDLRWVPKESETMSAYQPTPFAKTLLRECMRWRSQEQGGAAGSLGAPMWSDWLDGIHRDYRELAAELTETQAIRLHSHVAALNSSMAFAFNLFLPFHRDLDLGGWLAPSLGALVLDEVHFEWLPPQPHRPRPVASSCHPAAAPAHAGGAASAP